MDITLKRVRSTKDLAISSLTIIAGAAVYFLVPALGIIIILCGVLLLLFCKSQFKNVETGIILRKRAFDVAASCRNSIKDFLEGRSDEVQIKAPGTEGSVRLEVYYNVVQSIAYAELYDFSNYNYVPATGMTEVSGQKALSLISRML